MREYKQKTFQQSIACSGIGLHSGLMVNMTLLPAEPHTGIVFRRRFNSGKAVDVPARWDCVTNLMMCTKIGLRDSADIGTIEHLMSALAGCGIDNAVVELDGPEVPVMDGSAAPFVKLIEQAGVTEQSASKRWIKVLKPVQVKSKFGSASLRPGSGFELNFRINFPNQLVGEQRLSFDFGRGQFKNEISGARTFGFLEDVQKLWDSGLARGGSLDNAVVVSGRDVVNDGGLRFDDEFVRHKVLDAIGDLYLAGAPLIGVFTGDCSGHALNNEVIAKLMSDMSNWEYVTEFPDRRRVGANWAQRVAASPVTELV